MSTKFFMNIMTQVMYRIYKSYTKKLKNPKNLYKRSITGKFNKNNLYKYYI